MTKHLYIFALLLIASTSIAADSKPLKIVTTIKPLYSLVAGITQGVSQPKLLMSSNQSPHHYSLRPSERRMLANADLIFWIGPNMESFMPRLIDSLVDKNKAISLIQTQKLKLLPKRQAQHEADESDHESHLDDSKIDAHIWLSSHNVDILINAIADQLISIDPEHQQQYRANQKKLHKKVTQLRQTIQRSLISIDTAFLTYHDGYQYFEAEFGLNNAGFIASSELKPSAKRIRELKKIIKEKNIECIFYDAPTKPAVLNLFTTDQTINTFMLDPIGMLMPLSQNTWFEIMHSLAKQFINCQQHL